MGTENLRNKYRNHPIIKPIIDHCDEKRMGFEIIRETERRVIGLKCIKYINSYYMKIGDNLIKAGDNCGWNDLFRLIINAYNHLGLEYHENLVKAAKVLNRPI